MTQDTWLKTVKKISRYHKRAQKLNPFHSQKSTAHTFGVDPKVVTMSLAIYPVLADEEIKSKYGLKGAYHEVLKRRRDKKDHLIQRLFS